MPLKRLLEPLADTVYAILRIATGLMFAFHGVQKVFGVLTEFQPPIGSQLWIGGVIELVTGVAVAVGGLTAWAAFLASGTMAVAYIQFHWKLDFDARLLPAINKGEPALLYALLFLFIACRGGGKWSIDRRCETKCASRS